MSNARNGMDPSVVPQGLVGPMMPLPFEGSGAPMSTIDVQRPGPVPVPVPMPTLASALASATPENQRLVQCSSVLSQVRNFSYMS